MFKKKFCAYCGLPLSEECGCEIEIALAEKERLTAYFDSPETHLGWRSQDLIELRRRER